MTLGNSYIPSIIVLCNMYLNKTHSRLMVSCFAFILIMVGIAPLVLSNNVSAIVPGELYGVTTNDGGNSDFYRLLPKSIESSGPGFIATMEQGFSGIAFDSDGTLYAAGATGSSESFGTINPVDGTYTEISSSSIGCTDIAFDPTDGTLYCQHKTELYSLDKTTGVANHIGTVGLGNPKGNAIAISPSGILYYGNQTGLYTVDKTNGSVTHASVWTSNVDDSNCRPNAFDFDSSGTLWGSLNCNSGNYLVTIDITTSEMTLFDTTVDYLDGIAFAPNTPPSDERLSSVTKIGDLDHVSKGLAFVTGTDSDGLYSISPRDEFLRQVDPSTGETLNEIPLVYDSCSDGCLDAISGGQGLAYDSNSGTLWAIVTAHVDGSLQRLLAIVDLSIIPDSHCEGWCDSNLTIVGILPDKFAGLAVHPTMGLLGVTGDNREEGSIPPTLYTIIIPEVPDISTLLETNFVATFGNGDDGEAIAFNPIDNLLYHSSGLYDVIFETLDLNDNTLTPIYIGDTMLSFNEAMALGFSSSYDALYWSQGFSGNSILYRVELAPFEDTIAPTVDLSSVFPNPTNTSPIGINATFSEPVAGFSPDDISVIGGTVDAGLVFATGSTIYTFSVTPDSDGVLSVNIAANSAQDLAGNDNTASNTFSIEYDATAPTVILDTAYLDATDASPIGINATFSEPITGFSEDDISISGGSVDPESFFALSDTLYTFSVTPNGDGDLTVSIPADSAQDAAGNGNTASDVFTYVVDISFANPPKFGLQSLLQIEDSAVSATEDTITATISSNANSPMLVTLYRDGSAPEGNLFTALTQFTVPPPSPIDPTDGVCDELYVFDVDTEQCVLDPTIVFLNVDTDGDTVTVDYRTFTQDFTSSPAAVTAGFFGGSATDPTDTIRFYESDAYYVGSTATLRIIDHTFVGNTITGISVESSSGDTLSVDAIRIPGSDTFTTDSITIVSSKPVGATNVLESDVGTTISSTYKGVTAFANMIDDPSVDLLFAPDTTKVVTCLAADPNTGADTDSDGICDAWEHPAVNVALRIPTSQSGEYYELTCTEGATLDSDQSGASVCPKVGTPDLYVELDYMTGHKPKTAAINDVVTSFKNGLNKNSAGTVVGIRPHIIVDNEVQHVDLLPFSDGDPAVTTFLKLKKANFGTDSERNSCDTTNQDCVNQIDRALTAKRQVFRYGMFTHDQAGNVGSSGYAEKPGNDFIVSLGSFTGHTGTVGEQEATLLHELGHTLGLRHGGPDDVNCKPNYPSVMNYLYQFDGSDGGLLTGRPLDFSPSPYTTINEASLTDGSYVIGSKTRTMVIGGIDSGGNVLSTFTVNAGTKPLRGTPTAQPINWDRTATVFTGPLNVHYFANVPGCQDQTKYGPAIDGSFTGLRSQDDWNTIAFNFRVFDSFDSGAFNPQGDEDQEPTITIKKITIGGDGTFEFATDFGVSSVTTTDGAGSETSETLSPRVYSAEESTQPGWNLSSATCSDGSPINAIDLEYGEQITCTFTNTKQGPATLEQAINQLNTLIDDTLDKKHSKKLGNVLHKVEKESGKDHLDKACKEMDKFIKEVNKIKDLSSEEKTALINAANDVKAFIPC